MYIIIWTAIVTILKLSVYDKVIYVHVPVVVHVSLLVCVEKKIKTSC